MKRGYFVGLVSGVLVPPQGTGFAEDVVSIRGGFADYLRGLGFSGFTVGHYLRRLMRVAHWLHEQPRRLPLSKLTRRAAPNIKRLFGRSVFRDGDQLSKGALSLATVSGTVCKIT